MDGKRDNVGAEYACESDDVALLQHKAFCCCASDDELVLLRMRLYGMSEADARRNLKAYRLSFLMS